MRFRSSIAAVGLIGGLLSTSVFADTITQIERNDTRRVYLAWKRETARALGVGQRGSNERVRKIKLGICQDFSFFVGSLGAPVGSLTYTLIEFALRMNVMQQVLGSFPENLWKDRLAAYEATELEHIISGRRYDTELGGSQHRDERQFKSALARELNQFRRSSNTRYPTVHPEPSGCGDGPQDVAIDTIPPARRIQIINVHYYGVCEDILRNTQPERCTYWRDFSNEGRLSGRYKLLVTWDGGPPQPRDMNVDDLRADRNGVLRFRVTR